MKTLRLIFSAMTALVVAYFYISTTIDQPFEEKRVDCIISASSGDVKNIEILRDGSGSLSFSGDISSETQNKIKLCWLYEDAHKRVTKQFIWTETWEKVFVVLYCLVAIGIFWHTLWIDFVYSEDQQVEEKKKWGVRKKKK